MNLDSYLADFAAQSPTAAESISRILRQAILDGALAGGTTLRQADLAKQLGVSRIPVREALLKLEGEGLVETQPRRGVIVTSLSADDFNEILEMRFALESLALELAAQHFTKKDLDDALKLVTESQRKMPPAGNEDLQEEFESRWGSMNWAFHKRIYSVARRPRLLSTLENLHQLFARQLRTRINTVKAHAAHGSTKATPLHANRLEWEVVLEEHRQIAKACGRHDAHKAKEILKAHIFKHGGEVVKQLRVAQS
jgi:DNA-binding GntR family transcriptional regulator